MMRVVNLYDKMTMRHLTRAITRACEEAVFCHENGFLKAQDLCLREAKRLIRAKIIRKGGNPDRKIDMRPSGGIPQAARETTP